MVADRDRAGFSTKWLRPRLYGASGTRRVGALTDLRLCCRAGPYDLDVLVRDMERPRGVEIVGQLTRADDLHVPASGVVLCLVSVDETRDSGDTSSEVVHTSAFGEFSFARRSAEVLGIRLGSEPNAPTVLVWDRRP